MHAAALRNGSGMVLRTAQEGKQRNILWTGGGEALGRIAAWVEKRAGTNFCVEGQAAVGTGYSGRTSCIRGELHGKSAAA